MERKNNLRGAVADADAVRKFLIEKLGVPDDRILMLRNREATREGIISAIRDLASDKYPIDSEDPILIFYAGHGAEVEGDHDKVQMLVPHDFQSTFPSSSDTTSDQVKDNYQGHGVFDFTLDALLAALAKNKSDNIVSDIFVSNKNAPLIRIRLSSSIAATRGRVRGSTTSTTQTVASPYHWTTKSLPMFLMTQSHGLASSPQDSRRPL